MPEGDSARTARPAVPAGEPADEARDAASESPTDMAVAAATVAVIAVAAIAAALLFRPMLCLPRARPAIATSAGIRLDRLGLQSAAQPGSPFDVSAGVFGFNSVEPPRPSARRAWVAGVGLGQAGQAGQGFMIFW